MRIVVEVL